MLFAWFYRLELNNIVIGRGFSHDYFLRWTAAIGSQSLAGITDVLQLGGPAYHYQGPWSGFTSSRITDVQ